MEPIDAMESTSYDDKQSDDDRPKTPHDHPQAASSDDAPTEANDATEEKSLLREYQMITADEIAQYQRDHGELVDVARRLQEIRSNYDNKVQELQREMKMNALKKDEHILRLERAVVAAQAEMAEIVMENNRLKEETEQLAKAPTETAEKEVHVEMSLNEWDRSQQTEEGDSQCAGDQWLNKTKALLQEQSEALLKLLTNHLEQTREEIRRLEAEHQSQLTSTACGTDSNDDIFQQFTPVARTRRASTTIDVVSQHEKVVEDLQKRLDEPVDESMKRLKYIQLLEREKGELQQQLNEANAELKEVNEENKHLTEKLDENEYRLANTQKSLSEAEERIRQASTADVERKLKEYEEKCVELRRLQREIERLTKQREEAWRQADDLRKTNEDMNANIALAINERESAVERIGELAAELRTTKFEKSELQTQIYGLEDDKRRLKEAKEFLEGEQKTTASSIAQLQQEKSSYETQISDLQRSVSCAKEEARKEQQEIARKLQGEIAELKECGKQVEESLRTDTAALESARKKVEGLEAEQLAMTGLLNERNQEIDRLKDYLRRVNTISRDSDNTWPPTATNTSAVEVGQPAVEYHANESGHESDGGSQVGRRGDSLSKSQRAKVHAVQEKGTSSSYVNAAQSRPCAMCRILPASTRIMPCKHIVYCNACVSSACDQKETCPQCCEGIVGWANLPRR